MQARRDHKWTFALQFRRHAFGWRSQPAIKRVGEAVSEIKKAARHDPILGAEGAVLFLERVSPAIEHVDGSSGAMGTAVNKAVDALVPIIVNASPEATVRDGWLDRIWCAVEEDGIAYIESLSDHWGDLCVTRERASEWADGFLPMVRAVWGDPVSPYGYTEGTIACLSCLLKAGRYDEIMDLLEPAPFKFWPYRKWGVKALAAMGKKAEALRFAEDSRHPNDDPTSIAQVCEEILLSSGMAEEAYSRYAIEANQRTTYLATFRAVVKSYPHKQPRDILRDLTASTPGEEGKWFAAAKSAGLLDEAIELAQRAPCDPKTLTRAARDFVEKDWRFALEAGMAALWWLVRGYGYDITGLDVREAYDYTMAAADNAGCRPGTLERVREVLASEPPGERFVNKILGRVLGSRG